MTTCVAPNSLITYELDPDLSVDEFLDILVTSTLADRRPEVDLSTVEGMLRNTDLIMTARSNGQLVGVARALSDFNYSTYLTDLAVDLAFQRQGIGRELICRTHEAAGIHTSLILLSSPKAADFYPRIGMAKFDSCWTIWGKPRVS